MRRSKEKGNKNKQKCSRKNWHHKELAIIINLPDLDAISRCATRGRRKLILEARRYVSPPLLLPRLVPIDAIYAPRRKKEGMAAVATREEDEWVGVVAGWYRPTERGYQTTFSPAYEKAEREKRGAANKSRPRKGKDWLARFSPPSNSTPQPPKNPFPPPTSSHTSLAKK